MRPENATILSKLDTLQKHIDGAIAVDDELDPETKLRYVDPFATIHFRYMSEQIQMDIDSAGDEDERLGRIAIDQWALRCYDRAYRKLADSINSSHSTSMGTVDSQAHARAYFDLAQAYESIAFRDHGQPVRVPSTEKRP